LGGQRRATRHGGLLQRVRHGVGLVVDAADTASLQPTARKAVASLPPAIAAVKAGLTSGARAFNWRACRNNWEAREVCPERW
ncbi:hypothetical protein, partial [Corallococcus sp. 4LFB]|uniref:hypothetical protein n=1 Tax=Corallococcus sp. 4LFB TaxID=3383249 RepID=UPI003974B3C6